MKKGKFLVLPVLFIILIAGILKSGILRVDRVNAKIDSAACVTEEAVKSESGLLGGNILFFDAGGISQRLQSKYTCIKSVKVERKFPKEVKLEVEGRVALVRVVTFKVTPPLDLGSLEATPSSGSALLDWSAPPFASQQFLADGDGVIFAQAQNENVPLFYIPEQTVKLGQRLDAGVFAKAAIIFTELGKLGITVSEVKLQDQDFLIQSPQRIAFSLKKDVPRQIISLQLILQKAKIDERVMDTVDLRFDKPVVKYLPKK